MPNPNRLYSFRFPFDIQTTLESWREKLGSPLTGSFESVIARLSDRDRALEDYVNLGMSQGRLAYTVVTSSQVVAAGAAVDLTGYTVTVTVPANRVLRITGQAIFAINAPMTLTGFVNEDGTDVGVFGDFANASGADATAKEVIQAGSVIRTPAAGTHTYKLRGQATGGGAAAIGATAAAPGFIMVEDIGPVNT